MMASHVDEKIGKKYMFLFSDACTENSTLAKVKDEWHDLEKTMQGEGPTLCSLELTCASETSVL